MSLHIELLEQMQSLMTAGFALVAALAWNTAIQDLFARIFPDQNSLIAKFLYAVLITLIMIIVTRRLGKTISVLKMKLK
ncbi:hypothetical protein A2318_01775 [Candidatus Uhrbacteria bacterium RIFOXYB2_FULL_45_11]|uniref:EamA domain-containing protein n=1 Tax=Candidatus Uhrbacteria bacterium RIFOXYB2_FULL_45_11 TaxID=1802421 RepID=A0A1F7W3K9_9BACT|nr:MAG: hypothetical protein A2318_01775 [Candidatus Uhrbacteria bacterium RIFOXYB2_FULL_45_11]